METSAPFLLSRRAGSPVGFPRTCGTYLSSRSTTLTTTVNPMLRRMQVAIGMNTWCSPLWNDRSPGRRPRSGIRGDRVTRTPTMSTTTPMMISALPISCEAIACIVVHGGGAASPCSTGRSGPPLALAAEAILLTSPVKRDILSRSLAHRVVGVLVHCSRD